ncbi:hypothetical protein HanRHA438_Chr01g0035841 [Helianthus annuus]|nr:hypothetical protein HanRHA438_Chr01g0035841 [Helianthus annuus]
MENHRTGSLSVRFELILVLLSITNIKIVLKRFDIKARKIIRSVFKITWWEYAYAMARSLLMTASIFLCNLASRSSFVIKLSSQSPSPISSYIAYKIS